jgi:hypothetical protein
LILKLGDRPSLRPQNANSRVCRRTFWHPYQLARDGHVLKLPMARQSFFGKMTEQDLNAIVAWVRTI